VIALEPNALMIRLLFLSLLATVLLPLAAAPAKAYVVPVNPERSWTVWDGWGCSLAWWANQFGTRNDLADALFTTRVVNVTTDTGTYLLPGLGLNIARYNIGGTSTAPAGGSSADIPSQMPAYKRIQGFWLNSDSDDPASSSFDWTADANQRAMLLKARERGANLFEAFSNSPMWWMCSNHSTAGSANGGDNLQSWNYDQFARYLAIVAGHARSEWGIEFASVEPFNEPSAWWWTFTGHQEGCHFDVATQKQVLAYLRAELDKRGLKDVAIGASDENSIADGLNTWNSFDDVTKSQIGRVNVHDYNGQSAYRGPDRPPLYQAVSSTGKPLWMTEAGEPDGTGMTVAQSIVLDLNEMHATGWVYWQPLDSGGWGLVQSNPGDNWIGAPNAKYYVLAQFSRHIRPGMAMLDSGDPNTVAAYDGKARKLVLATVNGATAQWVTYDLSRFRAAAGPLSLWATNTGGGDQYVRKPDPTLTGSTLKVWLPANTVQTIEVSGVLPRHFPVRRVNAGGPAVGPFAADSGYTGGSTAAVQTNISADAGQAAPPGVYRSERNGDFTYTLGHLRQDSPYLVRLHFAESTFGQAGQRRFNVAINGVRVLTDYDIFTAAGGANKAVVESFSVRSDAAGTIKVVFSHGSAAAPTICGIEILADLSLPYTNSDLSRAMAIKAGEMAATPEDIARLETRGGGAAGGITLSDTVSIARSIAGLEPDP
jgi:galactan endo-1,6-beta-galactosidase